MKKHEFENALENLTELISMGKIMSARKQFDHLINVYNRHFEQLQQSKESYNKLKFALYTQHCTINHIENTEYEKGKIRGLIEASNMTDRYFKGLTDQEIEEEGDPYEPTPPNEYGM